MAQLGSGAYPTATSLDADDRLVAVVDGAVQEVPNALAKSFYMPSGFVDAADFAPLAGEVIDDCEATTNWTLTLPSFSETIKTSTLYFTQGTKSIYGSLKFHDGVASKIYRTFPTPLEFGTHTLIAFDVMWEPDGPNIDMPPECVCTVGDGTELVNGNLNSVPFPSVPKNAWSTVVLSLRGLSAVKSIGVKRVALGAFGRTDSQVNYRAHVLIDNVRFVNESIIDQALGAADSVAVFVPPSHTPDADQLPLHIGTGKAVIDPSRGVLSGLNNVVNLHDHLAYVVGAETGEVNVAGDIASIINNATPGQIVRASPGAVYRFDSPIVFNNEDVTVDFTGATIIQYYLADGGFCTVRCDRTVVTGGWWLGYYPQVKNGSTLVTVTGTPTTNGTTKELDALDEEARLPINTSTNKAFQYSRHLPQQLGLAPDGLPPRNYFDFSLKDSAQVANDCLIALYDDTTNELLVSATLTLTDSFVTYRLEHFRTDPRQRTRATIKKLTATTNTITVATVTTYGECNYNATYDAASCFRVENTNDLTLRDMTIEGFGGDAIQLSNLDVHYLHVDKVKSYMCRRQGMSFNQGTDMLIENCEVIGTGRSALDFEPYTDTWFTRRVRVRNIDIDCIFNYALAMGNWARNFDYVIEGITLGFSRFGMIFGGFVGGTMSNCVVQETLGDWDYEFMGADMLIDNCVSRSGVRCYGGTNSYDDGSGSVDYAPANNLIRGMLIIPSTVNRYVINATTTGYRFENITVSAVPTQPAFVQGTTGGLGVYAPGGFNAVNVGELSTQFPNTYKGVAYSNVWVPGGFNAFSDPIHSVRGISGTSTRSNNLRGVAATVAAGAQSHAVAFPARSIGELTVNSTITSNATAGSLAQNTAYYYRFGVRELFAGPATYRAQQTVTTTAGHTSVALSLRGTLDTANGRYNNSMTILRGTTNGGPYTTRYDVVPLTTFPLSILASNGVAAIDSGSTLTFTAPVGGYPASFAASTGSWTGTVDESGWEPDANYVVMVETNWDSGQPYITAKAVSGFTINFPYQAPGDGSGRVSWLLVR